MPAVRGPARGQGRGDQAGPPARPAAHHHRRVVRAESRRGHAEAVCSLVRWNRVPPPRARPRLYRSQTRWPAPEGRWIRQHETVAISTRIPALGRRPSDRRIHAAGHRWPPSANSAVRDPGAGNRSESPRTLTILRWESCGDGLRPHDLLLRPSRAPAAASARPRPALRPGGRRGRARRPQHRLPRPGRQGGPHRRRLRRRRHPGPRRPREYPREVQESDRHSPRSCLIAISGLNRRSRSLRSFRAVQAQALGTHRSPCSSFCLSPAAACAQRRLLMPAR